ncbi:uncharacterized protein C7orf50 [Colossoma macropomum]|uniref:uncharacterized protein C7orf50 n=1 Tax=Colossoma macropomum TaxID=42526 RepID=UPI0018641787|nr:uncharacterized protein C7orf50 [Colossoma macropomum]
MAKSQLLQPETSSEKKKSKQAVKDKKKMKRKKAEYEDSETCVPADDVTEVKKKKANINDVTTLEGKKKKKQRETKSKSSDEFISPAEADQPAEAQMNEVEEEGMEEEGMEGGDDLTPEERRVLERKLKKIRRKEEKKKQKEKEMSEKEGSKTSVAQKQALEYLTCWSEKRDEWKFQKTRQVWLLQHMFDSEKVSDAHFAVLLSYLEGLQGVARETTVQKAEALVRWGGQEDTEGGAAEAERRAHRAKEVIQILS